MNSLKISVITASYNQGRFASKCFDSVRNQVSNFQIEHIILDNCSNDETVKALEEYENNPRGVDLKVIVERDTGQTAAINRGFTLAKGDIICWLNTDEWYEKGALAKVMDYFERHPNIDVLFGNCDFRYANGALAKRKKEYFFSKSMLIYYGCFIPSCATFVRRRIIDAGIYLRPEFKVTMDFDWYVRIADAGYRFSHLRETLASFTWHESNISSTFVSRRLQERRLVQDEFVDFSGPIFLKNIHINLVRFFWIGIRIIRRLIR